MIRRKLADYSNSARRMGICLVVFCLVVLFAGLAVHAGQSDGKQWQRKQMAAKLQREAQPYIDKGMATLDQYVRTEDPKLNALIRHFYEKSLFNKIAKPMPPALPHRWLTQGGMYVGQWLWDSMFMVIPLAATDQDELIRDIFENWWYTIDNNPEAPKGSYRYGFVPNFLKLWPPVGFTQIPILGWGIGVVENETNDRKLIERALPYLITFDKWHTTERDVDEDMLIEFGAYKHVEEIIIVSLQQTARYEAFDLHPTTKTMKMTKHPKYPDRGQWYGTREGVEQTCFVLMSERAIVEIARKLGKEDIAQEYEKIVEKRIAALQKKMWDPKTKFFYTLERDTDWKVPIRTIQGFFTMTCGAATKEQAAMLVEQLQDPKQWWTRYPVPTAALDDKAFSPTGYWSGDMWAPTTYLVSLGLNKYGYHDLAAELTRRMIDLLQTKGINERYNGITGEPLGIVDLPMTCAVWLMIVQNIYGVQEDFRTIVIPSEAKGRHLLCGKLEVKYPKNDVVELRTKFEREFHVVYPKVTGALQVVVDSDGEKLPADKVKVCGNKVSFKAVVNKTYRVRPER